MDWKLFVRTISLGVIIAASALLVAATLQPPPTLSISGQPTPNPVMVGKPCTIGLTGHATPPTPANPEDKITGPTWSFNIVSVQYKNAEADTSWQTATEGDQYTVKSSQGSGSADNTDTFTFIFKTGAYWLITFNASVSYTDTTTNTTYSGTTSNVQATVTSYLLHIQYGGVVVDGKTQDVSVGEQIALTAEYAPSDMLLYWQPAGSVISGYTANNSSAKITQLSSTATARPTLSYYWMDTDSGSTENENVTLTGTIPDSPQEVSTNTTFNVYRPQPSFTTQYLGPVALDSYDKDALGLLALHDGNEEGTNNDPGIEFYFSIPTSQFGGIPNLWTVQIADRLTVTTEQFNQDTKSVTTFEYTIPNSTVPAPALDTQFTYWSAYPTVSAGGVTYYAYCLDAPYSGVDPPPAGSGFGPGNWSTYQVTISETFTHNLLFRPTVPSGVSAIDAPLSQVSWGWNADANNPNNGGFTLANPQQAPASPPQGSDLASLPLWNSNAWPSWNSPQWGAP